MKRCPACDKTFPDAMKFCQTDGTLLVEDAPAADPYKTVVGNQSDIASAIPPVDPFKTMVASPPPKKADEDLLELPDEPDLLKTMVVSKEELLGELKLQDDAPPSYAPSAPLIEPKPAAPKDVLPEPPKFNEPSPSPPNFGDLSSPKTSAPKPFESKPFESNPNDATAIMDSGSLKEGAPSPFDAPKPTSPPFGLEPPAPSPFDSKPPDFSGKSSYGSQENKPIPSPFDGSMIGYQPPAAPPPFDPPKPPPVKEDAPPSPFGNYQEPADAPFQPPSPFGTNDPFNQPAQTAEWTPPPAPLSELQNQEMSANTPFQPPVAASGQNQTLPIVSLVLGIISLCCYVSPLTGLAAIVTGYLGMKNANTDPAQYGGKTLAIVGMALGGLFFLIGVVYYIFWLVIGFASLAVPR